MSKKSKNENKSERVVRLCVLSFLYLYCFSSRVARAGPSGSRAKHKHAEVWQMAIYIYILTSLELFGIEHLLLKNWFRCSVGHLE